VTSVATSPGIRVRLRDARWTDLPALTALEARVFPDDAWSQRSWWAELAGRPRREYVVAVAADGPDAGAAQDILGYGGLDHGGEVSDVMTVVVAPAGRGAGLGRLLLAELEARAARRGAAHVMLEVRADNEAALRLYERAGYVVLNRRRGYYQPGGTDALVMRRTLGDGPQGEETDRG
jgi:ribosomal-protein-alanine N-acetyltransferase